jgi:hypothetical protein
MARTMDCTRVRSAYRLINTNRLHRHRLNPNPSFSPDLPTTRPHINRAATKKLQIDQADRQPCLTSPAIPHIPPIILSQTEQHHSSFSLKVIRRRPADWRPTVNPERQPRGMRPWPFDLTWPRSTHELSPGPFSFVASRAAWGCMRGACNAAVSLALLSSCRTALAAES